MGFLGKLVKGALDVALLPVAVATDVVTGFGMATDEKEPFTVQRIKKVVEDIEEAGKEAGDGEWL